MAMNKEMIVQLYQSRAKWYDFSANTYYLIGLREFAYRKMAVRALNLNPGDTVVEIGCGTGLNFGLLHQQVGPQGRIIGVDLTAAMLTKANRRIRRNHWTNVSLTQSDAATFQFPGCVDGIISTFALTLVPEYDQVIKNAASALPTGKRLVILDFKMPEKWPMWLVHLFVILTRPFGVTLDLGGRQPWKSVDRYLVPVEFKSLYFGGIYIGVGQAG
jgi:ubiquinone/menaquinone biosynthesis C-methylase UbiE